MTKVCKIWLWFLLFSALLSMIIGISGIKQSLLIAIVSILCSLAQVAAIYLMLFKLRKEGFYLLMFISVIGVFFDFIQGINIVMSLLVCVIRLAVTYFLFLNGETGAAVRLESTHAMLQKMEE